MKLPMNPHLRSLLVLAIAMPGVIYAAETPAQTAVAEGVVVAAASGSFLGVQFHPEKSGAAGARFLEQCLSRA